MNTVTRTVGEVNIEFRPTSNVVSFRSAPQLPPVGMKLSEAVQAAKAVLAIAVERYGELSDDSLAVDEAAELRQALYPSNTLDMSEDEYVDYLALMREDGLYDGISAHWGQD